MSLMGHRNYVTNYLNTLHRFLARGRKCQLSIACSRLRDGGGKSFSNKKCEKRTGAGERQGGGACTHFFNGLFRYISSSAAMSCLDVKISLVPKHKLIVPSTLLAPATHIRTDKATKP